MSNSSTNIASGTLNVAQFKAQALQSMFLANPATDLFATQSASSDLFDNLFSDAKNAGPFTSTTPTGLDASKAFSRPGQNVMTIINRVEVSFKAQFSELSALKNSLANELDVAQKLATLDEHTSVEDIKSTLKDFIDSYNAGVNRFAPDIARGGILEGSQEAAHARFATQRDISNPLIGADSGMRGGMSALGISVDAQTGLAILNEVQLDAALAQDKNADVRTIIDFANSFTATTTNLNAQGNPQDRQLSNLDNAIHWIDSNRDAVQQEFGVGKTATPDDVFAKAAAAYKLFAL